MSVEERALAAGSDSAAIATANSLDFLKKCLQAARLDPDLQNDVFDACELQEYTALTLASGDLTPSAVESKLYLTGDEATRLLHVCARQCDKIGAFFGRNLDAEFGPEEDEETARASADANKDKVLDNGNSVPPVSTAVPNGEQHATALRSDVDTPSTPDLPEKNRESSSANEEGAAPDSAPKPSPPTITTSPEKAKSTEKPASHEVGSPKDSGSGKKSARGRPVSAPAKPHVEPLALPRTSSNSHPGSARKPPMRRTGSVETEDVLSPSSDDATRVPSYLRATAAHKARSSTTKGEHSNAPTADSRAGSTSAQSTPRGRTLSVAGFISTTLMRPTASFLNRLQPAKEDTGRWSPPTEERRLSQSTSLSRSESLKTPRATKMEPFRLSTDLRATKEKALTTEELQMQKAKAEADKVKNRKELLKNPMTQSHSAQLPTKMTRPASATHKKPTQFKPFNLASLERHQKAQEELQKKIAEEKAKEEQERSKFSKKPSSRSLSVGTRPSKKQLDPKPEAAAA